MIRRVLRKGQDKDKPCLCCMRWLVSDEEGTGAAARIEKSNVDAPAASFGEYRRDTKEREDQSAVRGLRGRHQSMG